MFLFSMVESRNLHKGSMQRLNVQSMSGSAAGNGCQGISSLVKGMKDHAGHPAFLTQVNCSEMHRELEKSFGSARERLARWVARSQIN